MTKPVIRAARALLWASVAVMTLGSFPHAGASLNAACQGTVVEYGLEHLDINLAVGPINGESLGQTFAATDTLIDSIIVWRVPTFSTIGVHIIVTGTDSTGKPNTNDVLIAGQTLVSNDIDPASGLIILPFTFSPPLVLPKAGTYAFFLQPEGCYDAEPWRIMDDYPSPTYEGGVFWISNRTAPYCALFNPRPHPDADLLFRIHFCTEPPVSVRPKTWGQLKAIYR